MPPTTKTHRKPQFNAVSLQRELDSLADHLSTRPPGSRPNAVWMRDWLVTITNTYADGPLAAASLRMMVTAFAVNQLPPGVLNWFDNSTHYHHPDMRSNNEYHDNSTGPTGAKAFGPGASASSTGAVTQLAGPGIKNDAELAQILAQLIALIDGVSVPETAIAKKDEAATAIKQAQVEAASGSGNRSKIKAAWEAGKAWVSNAISFGAFAAEKAKDVEKIIDQVGNYMSR